MGACEVLFWAGRDVGYFVPSFEPVGRDADIDVG